MLVSAANMLQAALREGRAVGQFNINNLEWVRAALEAAAEMSSPVILGVTRAACSYMGGLASVAGMVEGMIKYLRPGVPVALHLDHSDADFCLEAIGAGFTSVMFDGSHMPFAENLAITAKLAKICKESGVSLEAELGSPAGEEDGITGSGARASVAECVSLAKSGADVLAASIGNIHGEYPPDWPGLDFTLLEKIHASLPGLPLALHGGSGVPEAMIAKAIKLGVAKINVNTECQIAFAAALEKYFIEGRAKEARGYNLQRIMKPGLEAVKNLIMEKMRFFDSA